MMEKDQLFLKDTTKRQKKHLLSGASRVLTAADIKSLVPSSIDLSKLVHHYMLDRGWPMQTNLKLTSFTLLNLSILNDDDDDDEINDESESAIVCRDRRKDDVEIQTPTEVKYACLQALFSINNIEHSETALVQWYYLHDERMSAILGGNLLCKKGLFALVDVRSIRRNVVVFQGNQPSTFWVETIPGGGISSSSLFTM